MLILGLFFSILALIIIIALIVKPLYEERRRMSSHITIFLLYVIVKLRVKIERFLELRRKLIEAKVKAEKIRK